MKRISILGSTGSIGRNTLKIANHLKDRLTVVGIAANRNIDLLEQQAREFSPKIIGVYNKEQALKLQKRLPQFEVIGGMEGLIAVATESTAAQVMSCLVGTVGIQPTIAAIESGKEIALANKEVLVSAGALVMELAAEKGVSIIPVDSEHSALFQCLEGKKKESVRRLILTASGGPFRSYSPEEMRLITLEKALQHPNWKMGPKVTIDSSTLMNKGLEVIEAHWLFGISYDRIDVVIHPQSIIHSLVEFVDFSMLAQLGIPDMVVPIQYALTYPEKERGILEPFDFTKHALLQFFPPDLNRFRCLNLAFQAVKAGGSLPCYMNAANESLVKRFLNREISWLDISRKLDRLMERHEIFFPKTIEEIFEVDAQARQEAELY